MKVDDSIWDTYQLALNESSQTLRLELILMLLFGCLEQYIWYDAVHCTSFFFILVYNEKKRQINSKILFLIAMSLKPPSILHCLDSMTVVVGRLFTSSALNITIVEALRIREVSLDDHWRFFSRLYQRASVWQSCFTAIASTQHGTDVINALL